MRIPLYIELAKERSASFHRCVDLLRLQHGDSFDGKEWLDLWDVVGPYVRESSHWIHPLYDDIPVVVEKALAWVYSDHPSILALRVTRQILDTTLAYWTDAWSKLAKILKLNSSKLSENHWFRDAVAAALVRLRYATKSLEEGWPVDSDEVEQKTLEEMKSGQFVELDDAFARIAGLSVENWQSLIKDATTGKAKD